MTTRTLRIATPVGPLEITATGEAVTAIRFCGGTADATRGAALACRPDNSTRPLPGDRPGYGAGGNGSGIADVIAGGKAGDAARKTATDIAGGIPAGESVDPADPTDPADPAEDLLRHAARELAEYLAGTRQRFTFPVAPTGTLFQQAVWAALQTIPCGQTRTYGQIAAQIGRPKACRAVGMANNRNPVSIAIPCHRVVGSKGALTGYAGGLDAKAFLLRLEAQPEGSEGSEGSH